MFDELFDDYIAFTKYMRANDSKEVRDRLLLTDRLRYWYCSGVEDRESVWSTITDPEWAAKYKKMRSITIEV